MKSTIARKVLAYLVSAAMVAGLTPIFAYADSEAANPAVAAEAPAASAQDAVTAAQGEAGQLTAGSIADDADGSTHKDVESDAEATLRASSDSPVRVSTWSELEDAVEDGPNGQVIQLTRNIYGSGGTGRIEIEDYSVTIDLNGYTLSRGLSSSKSNGHVIEVYGNKTLTIKDSSATNGNPGTGKITGGYSAYGGGIYVHEDAILKVYGGTICDNNASVDGGGVYVDGDLRMYGGTISGNDAGDSGGGIFVTSNGGIDLRDAVVTGNTACKYGGGIYAHLDKEYSSEIEDCTISHNVADEGGGGLYMNAKEAKLIISGSAVENNRAESEGGGGLYLQNGTLKMGTISRTGGSLSHNWSKQGGGGVKVTSGTTFEAHEVDIIDNTSGSEGGGGVENIGTATIENCNINWNHAKTDGGGIRNDNSGTLSLQNCSVEHNNATVDGGGIFAGKTLSINGGSIKWNAAGTGKGNGIYVGKYADTATKIQGELVVQDNGTEISKQDVYLRTGKVLGFDGPLTGNARIGVTMESETGICTSGYALKHISGGGAVPTDPGSSSPVSPTTVDDPSQYFFSPEGFEITLSQSTGLLGKLGEVTLSSGWEDLQSDIDSTEANGTLELTRDYVATSKDTSLKTGKNITIDLKGHTLNRNGSFAKADGHVIEVFTNAKLTITDSSEDQTGAITGGNALFGGGILVNDSATLSLEGGTIAGNTAECGGGVFVVGTMRMSGGAIAKNTASTSMTGFGAGIYVDGILRTTGGVITGNESPGFGGGIYASTNADIDLKNTSITYNKAAMNGGGIDLYLEEDDFSTYIENCTISHNEAEGYGGGLIMEEPDRKLKIVDSFIDNNTSGDDGGGIYLREGTISVQHSSISGNDSACGAGGVKVTSGTEFSATDTDINGNIAQKEEGGGIKSVGVTELENCRVIGNSAKEEGGGVFNDDTGSGEGEMTLKDCIIANNNTESNGGGVYSDATLEISNVTIGACTLEGGEELSGNMAAGDGGGAFIGNAAVETRIKGAIVMMGNTAQKGKDLYLRKGRDLTVIGQIFGTSIGLIDMQNPDVFTVGYGNYHNFRNESSTPSNYFGTGDGAVAVAWAKQMKEVQLKSTWPDLQTQINNTPRGGKITLPYGYTASSGDDRLKVTKDITIDLAGHTLDRNLSEKTENGHVIEVFKGATLTIMDSSNEKTGTLTGGCSKYGGGIYVNEGATVRLLGGTIVHNNAEVGGGIYLGGTLMMSGGAVAENNAAIAGGICAGGTMEMSGGAIAGNRAQSIGGGIFADGTVSITGGTISDNEAEFHGGGIGTSDNCKIKQMSNATISRNTAGHDGGGIILSAIKASEPVHIQNCTITDNTASEDGGGLYMSADGAGLVINNTRIEHNTARGSGGGVYLYYGAITMNDGALAGNVATDDAGGIKVTSKTTFTANRVEISGNRAGLEEGGGVKNLGTAALSDCTIYGNSAKRNGGGIYNDDGGQGILTLTRCVISGNSTERNGGGVYSDATLRLIDGTIGACSLENGEELPGNTAVEKGGGIFIDKDADSTSIRGGLGVEGNSAQVFGNDVLLCSGQKLALSGKLTSGTKILVDIEDGCGILTENYAKYCTSDLNGRVAVDNPSDHFGVAKGYYLGLSKGEVEIKTEWSKIKDEIESADDGDWVTLHKDYAATPSDDRIKIPKGKRIKVDLNGHTLNRNRSEADKDGHVFEVFGTLSLYDYSSEKTGKVTGGWANKGGGINVSSSGQLNVVSGTICGNKADVEGGGIYAHGILNMKGGVVTDNESYGSGGGIGLDEDSTLSLEGGVVSNNTAKERGGGISMDYAAAVSVKGTPVVQGNNSSTAGHDIYLPSNFRLTVAGALGQEAMMGVALENDWGTFTSGYGAYNNGVNPALHFASTQGYAVYDDHGEAAMGLNTYGETDYAKPFIDRENQINVNTAALGGEDWMSGISGARYLNEINMPGTHDAGMNNVQIIDSLDMTCIISALASNIAGKFAETQNLDIDDQLASGARQFDIRLCNRYKKFKYRGYYWEDDGENLWLCHGTKKDVGTYFALDEDDEPLSFNEVLGWMKDFLRKHPTETIILNFRPETSQSGKSGRIYKRARKIMESLLLETNPSTGEPYLYREKGSNSSFAEYSHMPQLKDCRGKIVLYPADDDGIRYCGGFKKKMFVEYTDPTNYKLTASEKVTEVVKAYSEMNRDGEVRIPSTSDENLGVLWYWELSCTGEDQGFFAQYIMGGDTPVEIAEYVNPRLIGDGKLFGPDRAGQYIGWVRLDGFEAKYAESIWRTNFFETQQYCTVTVEPALNDSHYETQTYRVLKGTQIQVPGNIYKQLPQGRYLGSWKAAGANTNTVCYPAEPFKIEEDVTFTAQWLQEGQVPVRIVWKDGDDADKLRPHSVNFDVTTVSGEPAQATSTQITLKDEGRWSTIVTAAISDIAPKWELIVPTEGNQFGQDAEGQYKYTESHEDGDGYTFTFCHTPRSTTAVSGSIVWDDGDDADGLRPKNEESVTIRLYANGTEVASRAITAADGWQYAFDDLAQYVNGEKVEYSISEDDIEGYSSFIDGFSVTNSHVVSEAEVVEAMGIVTWDDADNEGGKRPESVAVHLLANGERLGTLDVVEGEDGLWTFSFGDVPISDASGQIDYSIETEGVAGYATDVEDIGVCTFRIVNSLIVQQQDKEASVIEEAPKANELTYSGKPQVLVSKGGATGGTMMYALSAVGANAPSKDVFSAELPKGTNAGTYSVWYYVKGDALHEDSAVASVTASIAKAEQTVKARNVTGEVGEAGLFVAATVIGAGDTGGVGAVRFEVTDGADVVGVNAATGELTLRKVGTATVSVTAAETPNYFEASKDVAITVKSAERTVTFYEDTEGTKVWQRPKLQDGAPLAGLAAYGTDADHLLKKEGYTLAGWATEPGIVVDSFKTKDGVLNPLLEGVLVDWSGVISQDMYVYPIWIRDRLEVHLAKGCDDAVTWGIGFDGNTQLDHFTVNIDEKLRMEGLNTTTRAGYVLDGWYTQGGVRWSEGGNWGVTPEYCDKDDSGSPIVLTNEERKFNYYTVTLTAHWTPESAEAPRAEVTYVLGDHAAVGATVPTQDSVSLGDEFTLAATPAAADDYVFAGWRDGTGVLYWAGGTYSFDSLDKASGGAITLTAQWVQSKAVILTFDAAGGTAVPPVTDDSSVTVDLSDLAYSTNRAGYTFDGWYEGGTKREGTYTVTASTTLTAHWTINRYKITFNSAGGSDVAAIEQDFGTAITAPQDPEKARYDFMGWKPALPATMPAGDMTVKATWAPKTYTMSFDANGGSDVAAIRDIFGARVDAPQDPVREGFAFIEWLNAAGQAVSFPLYMPDSNMTLTARWKSVPEAPAVDVQPKDAHSVIVTNAVPGAEYIIVPFGQKPDAQDWANAKTLAGALQASSVIVAAGNAAEITFDGLSPVTLYDVWGRMVETEDAVESEATRVSVMTSKEPQAAPAAPDAQAVDTSEVDVIAPLATQEYALVAMGAAAPADDDSWLLPGEDGEMTWVGLEANTEYDVYTRLEATSTKSASPPSEPTTVKTAALPVPVPGTHTVTWVNDDGTLLEQDTVEHGAFPSFRGDVPKKAPDERYTYAFKGWEPAVVAATVDATYKATYEATPVNVPIKKGSLTFDFDGGTLDGKTSLTIVADVGDVITIPNAPVKEGYEFKYWRGSEYHPGDKYTVEGDHAFTAVWEKKASKPSDEGENKKSSDAGKGEASSGGGGDAATKATSPAASDAKGSAASSTKGSAAKTGDSLEATTLALLVAIACIAFGVAILSHKRRRDDA